MGPTSNEGEGTGKEGGGRGEREGKERGEGQGKGRGLRVWAVTELATLGPPITVQGDRCARQHKAWKTLSAYQNGR